MRKLGLVLVGLGAFLLVMSLLVKFYMVPAMTKTPLDVNSTTYLDGNAEIFRASEGTTESMPVKATSITQTDGKASSDDVVVWVNSTCVVKDEGADTPDCVSADDPRLVNASVDHFATDRVTAESVNDPEFVPDDAPETEGLRNKFPFDAQKETYKYWDSTLGEAVDVEFVEADEIDGLEVYKYQQTTTDEPIDIVEGIPGTYSMDRTIVVEPVTGSIVDQQQHDVRVFDNGDTALDMELAFTDEQVKKSVSEGKDSASQLNLINSTVPLGTLVLGLIALVAGLLLARRKREDAAPEE